MSWSTQVCRCKHAGTYPRPYAGCFSWGGKIIYNIRGITQTRARSARAGGGCGRGVLGAFAFLRLKLNDLGAFAFLRLKLNDLVHTLGGFFIIKKVRRKYIFMENECFLHYRITGCVKSKHKQYDHWHSQNFSTGGQSEGAKRPSGGRVWDHGREIFFLTCVSKNTFFAH